MATDAPLLPEQLPAASGIAWNITARGRLVERAHERHDLPHLRAIEEGPGHDGYQGSFTVIKIKRSSKTALDKRTRDQQRAQPTARLCAGDNSQWSPKRLGAS